MCQTSKCKEIFLISRSYLSGDFFELRTWVVCSLQWNCSFLSAWVGSLVEHGTSNIFRWSLRQWQFWWGLGSHQTLETVALAGVGLGGIEPEIALEMLKLKIWYEKICIDCIDVSHVTCMGLSFVASANGMFSKQKNACCSLRFNAVIGTFCTAECARCLALI